MKPATPLITRFFKPVSRKTQAKAELQRFDTQRTAAKQARAERDKSLALAADGSGNGVLAAIHKNKNEWLKAHHRAQTIVRADEMSILERELPACIVPMPAPAPAPAFAPTPTRAALDAPVPVTRQRLDWRGKYRSRMLQALKYFAKHGSSADDCNAVLLRLKADEVLNADKLFDLLKLGTLRRWVHELADSMGSVEDYCTPKPFTLSRQHMSPVTAETKIKLKTTLDNLGAAGATLNSTVLGPVFKVILMEQQPGLFGSGFKMSKSWINELCASLGQCG